jgi:cobalt/nickel transport system permease protein
MSGTTVSLDIPFLCRWDPRLKIIGLFLLAFTFSFVGQLRVLPVMIAITLALTAASGMPPSRLAISLRYPSLLILGLVVLLPVISGFTPLVQWGGLTVTSEGLQASLVIAVRFLCIVTLATVFLGTTPLLVNIKAVQSLGLPYIMADMALLVTRYLEVFSKDLRQMRIAMKLKGHDDKALSGKNLRTMAWLAGSLLLRSYERSHTVYMAMRLRGYGAGSSCSMGFQVKAVDVSALIGVCVLAVLLVWLETTL